MLNKFLDALRIGLYIGLLIVGFFFYQAWEKEHIPLSSPGSASSDLLNNNKENNKENNKQTNNYIPSIKNIKTENSTHSNIAAHNNINKTLIHVKTDTIEADIDLNGGNITQVKLLHYPEALHSTQPFLLLNNDENTRYLAQSGLLSAIGPDTSESQANYTAEKTEYVLSPDQKNLEIKLYWQNKAGIKVIKSYIFKHNQYAIDLNYQIENQTTQPWKGNLYLQLLRKDNPAAHQSSLSTTATYFGAAISSPDKRYQKIPFSHMKDNNLDEKISDGWAAMIQHYFVSAWVPDSKMPLQYFSRVTSDDLYTIGMISPAITVAAGQTLSTQATLYSGPAIADYLEQAAPSLKLTIDYGWFWFISGIIFWMMQHIYNIIGNWGWSIVIVTLIIKLMFYHLSAKSYRSMSGMKKLQPKLMSLKERFGDDKQKLSQATMELYKKEKINPMSGCLPIIIQIPVFIGLYWVLIESVQLRQAPFILWIHDLSVKDPYYVLPILMGLSMLLQQRLNPPPADPMQAKIMLFMPIVFTLLFMNFPAGLMLYWFANNLLSFLQQWTIMRSIDKVPKEKK